MPHTAEAGTTTEPYGYVAPDLEGSYEEWFDGVVSTLMDNWAAGLGLPDPRYITPDMGMPNKQDQLDDSRSFQSQQFFEAYVRANSDPWIARNFGPAPTRHATFEIDPDRPGEIARLREEGADRRLGIAEAGATERVQLKIDAAWRISQEEIAARLYIAEGDWGVQKWMTEQNNTGAMDRLMATLGVRREELAQRAIEAQNQHKQAMMFLALEVAQYDADLASKPRNWIAYAAWLSNRGVVVDGLSLAMAAQEVPETELDAQETQESTGSGQAATEAAEAGEPGGPVTQSAQERAAQDAGTGVDLGAKTTQQAVTTTTPGAAELGDMTMDEFLKQLFGDDAAAGPDLPAMQNVLDSLRTTEGPSPTATNALGLRVAEFQGKDVDPRAFTQDLNRTQKQMKVGAVESVRGQSGGIDFLGEIERFRPKGGATGPVSFG